LEHGTSADSSLAALESRMGPYLKADTEYLSRFLGHLTGQTKNHGPPTSSIPPAWAMPMPGSAIHKTYPTSVPNFSVTCAAREVCRTRKGNTRCFSEFDDHPKNDRRASITSQYHYHGGAARLWLCGFPWHGHSHQGDSLNEKQQPRRADFRGDRGLFENRIT